MEPFRLDFEVRDNEVDIQGVVNNANYFIYMAHTRHKHIQNLGVDFADFAKKGLNLYLIHTEATFKAPLFSNDKFYVTSELKREGKIKFAFMQEVRKIDDTLVLKAKNITVCIDIHNNNKPVIPDTLLKLSR